MTLFDINILLVYGYWPQTQNAANEITLLTINIGYTGLVALTTDTDYGIYVTFNMMGIYFHIIHWH